MAVALFASHTLQGFFRTGGSSIIINYIAFSLSIAIHLGYHQLYTNKKMVYTSNNFIPI